MRHAFTAIALFITLMSQVSAHTDPLVTPVLRFDRTSFTSAPVENFLRVVPEEVDFPAHPQKVKFERALGLIEEVMNSEEFKVKVLTYVNAKGEKAYSRNYLWGDSSKPLSHEDVYRVIMTGNEKTIENTIGEMNLNSLVKICKLHERASVWCRTVVGSTSPRKSKWIELNWKFYSRYETHEMVENLVHEWLHLLGFLHGEENIHEEVPYVVGKIAGEIAKDILGE